MFRNTSILIVIVSMLVFSGAAQAARDITGPLDTVVGVPDDGIEDGGNDSGWPPNELPPFAVDDQVLTKYLHFRGNVQPTGFRVTPAVGPTVVTGLTFTTANDAEPRDPVEYELSGSNESIDGPYTLIAEGPIVDFAGSTAWPRRTKTETPISFANTVSYKHYQVMFPVVRDPGSANSMQIAEVELLELTLKASGPAPEDGAIHEDTWANLAWTTGAWAVSHDVYFGENPDDVEKGTADTFQGNQTASFLIVGFPGFLYPKGLATGSTYYWRVDEVNDANPDSPWTGDVWSFTVPPKIAWKPYPPNNAKFIDLNADLRWNPGWGAKMHTVYFGDNFDDVNNAADGLPQIPATYELETLELGKTYYWRVDEFDALATYKGDVWSFTTARGEGGIKGEYFNNENLSGTPALTRIEPEVNFSFGGASPGAPIRDSGWSARWTSDLEILFSDTYTFSVYSQGGTRLWIDDELVLNMWVSWVPTEYAALPMYLESGTHSLRLEYYLWDTGEQQLYWSTPTMPKEIIPAGPLQPPLRARRPNPPNGAVDVTQTPMLSWSTGDQAASHQVYFGTDENAVLNAATGSPEDIGTKDLGSQSYDPGQLEWDTTYYWRVDEVNDTNPDSPWTGAVWGLKTANSPVIDDFEYYNDLEPDDPESNNIFYTWLDGFDDPANGSLVGYEFPPFAERIIVHGGKQSMPLYYDNSVTHSEAELTLDYPRDWTEGGVNTLTIWFYGDPNNAAEQLYVALNGSAVVTHDNPDAAQIEEWTEWIIDLQAFADQGVDLTNVNTIALGLGDKNNPQPGGTGTMFFDDIRLNRPQPVDPGTDGLVAAYVFETDATDSSGNGYDGTLLGDAHVADGVLVLDGDDDAVAIPGIGDGLTEFTFSMMVYPTVDVVPLQFSGGINTDSWGGGVHLKLNNGTVNVGVEPFAGGDVVGTSLAQPNTWTHLALTVSPEEVAVYFNGEKEGSRIVETGLAVNVGAATIGAWNNSGTDVQREMTGQMDDVLIYNRALSAAEILYLAGN